MVYKNIFVFMQQEHPSRNFLLDIITSFNSLKIFSKDFIIKWIELLKEKILWGKIVITVSVEFLNSANYEFVIKNELLEKVRVNYDMLLYWINSEGKTLNET